MASSTHGTPRGVVPSSPKEEKPKLAVLLTGPDGLTRATRGSFNAVGVGLPATPSSTQQSVSTNASPRGKKTGDQTSRAASPYLLPGLGQDAEDVMRKKNSRAHKCRLMVACNLRNFSWNRGRIATEKEVPEPDALAEAEFLYNLKGANGRWKQKQAEEVYPEYVQMKEAIERERKMELERQKRAKIEEAEKRQRMRALQIEEQQRKEVERRKRLQEEERRQQELEKERERLRREEEERQRRLREPRPCTICNSTGECQSCNGRGCFHALYLASVVDSRSKAFHGRMVSGCDACGGGCLEKEQVELRKGTGKCSACGGLGKIAPPIAAITPDPNEKKGIGSSRAKRTITE